MKVNEFLNNKFAVLGMAESGIAAARKLQQLKASVFLSEYKTWEEISNSKELNSEFSCEFGGHSEHVLNQDIIVLSPGIPTGITILQKAKNKGIKIISEIELGYRLKANNSKIIAVTGSNGKSTTVSIIHHLLQAIGFKSILAGNIGIPFTSYPIEKEGIDFIVLELSSFQLETIDLFKADSALLLNITPDHLNRYRSFQHYADTKIKIFSNQTKNDLAVLNADDAVIKKTVSSLEASQKSFSLYKRADCFLKDGNIIVNDKLFPVSELPVQGPHNILNTMASLLAISPWTFGREQEIRNALKTFSPLSHRLETVAEIQGIKFVNDSKATNSDSVKYALQSFSSPIHIILGGSDKGEDFSVLIPYLQKSNAKIYLIGATRNRMAECFKNKLEFSEYENLKQAVRSAAAVAIKGDVILLSPACASYDAFKNFIHRGNSFKKIVDEIKNEIEVR